MKIAFIHPDLGIGGAERLVVDFALALQNKGHDVTIYTSHHDPSHAFDETSNGTLKVKVSGNTIVPRNIFGKFSILCAISRQLHLTLNLIFEDKYDVYIADQLPAAIPYLRLTRPDSRILFYCHHPDLVLTARNSLVKKLYRLPFDVFEKWCTAKSDQIAVNSAYTRQVFFRTFGKENMPDPSILYPVVDPAASVLSSESKISLMKDTEFKEMCHKLEEQFGTGENKMLLSVNRFERKKDVDLAISAFSLLLHAHSDARKHTLIVAGGYDLRVKENIEYLEELKALATKFRIPFTTKFPSDSWKKVDFSVSRVVFLPSVSSSEKLYLLERSTALLYTPTNEHFGIVPLEAMGAETPVLATNTGGPLETVVDGETGWLRKPDMEDWYRVLKSIVLELSAETLANMGQAGRARVEKEFTLSNMETLANNLVLKTQETPRKNEDSVSLNTYMVTASINCILTFLLIVLMLLIRFSLWIYPHLVASLQW